MKIRRFISGIVIATAIALAYIAGTQNALVPAVPAQTTATPTPSLTPTYAPKVAQMTPTPSPTPATVPPVTPQPR